MTHPLIWARHLAKAIPGEPDSYALTDAQLSVVPGEFVAIVGPSGSGKTTLLSILGLLARPDAGEYFLDGQNTASLYAADLDHLRATQVGFVFQNSFVIGEDTVLDNVALPLRTQGLSSADVESRVTAAVRRVGLLELMDRPAGELSGGEKQRVAVARALVTEPKVLLADEPTGALDGSNSERLIELLNQISATGTTVVVVTHDPLVAGAADRQIALHDGRVDSGDTSLQAMEEPGPALIQRSDSRLAAEASHTAAVTTLQRLRSAAEPAWSGLVSRPTRSMWVVLAYALGVAALVAALGLTNSARGTVVARLTAAGSEMVRVFPPGDEDSSSYDPAAPQSSLQKLRELRGVAQVAPVRSYPGATNAVSRLAGGKSSRFDGRIHVTTAIYLDMHGMHAISGDPWLLDNPWDGPVAVLGSSAAEALSVAGAEPGVVVHVNSHPVAVAAVLAAVDDSVLDDTIYLSAGAVSFLGASSEQMFEIRTEAGYAEPVAAAVPALLAPASPGRYTVASVAQLRSLQSAISSDLTRLLQVLGVVIVLLSTTTAAISLLLSIRARAPQIALRRTVGASRAAIWLQFTLEGVLVGLLGGAFGTAAGVALAVSVAAANGEEASLGLSVVILGVGVSLLGGIVSSSYPALQAARQDPAAILRQV